MSSTTPAATIKSNLPPSDNNTESTTTKPSEDQPPTTNTNNNKLNIKKEQKQPKQKRNQPNNNNDFSNHNNNKKNKMPTTKSKVTVNLPKKGLKFNESFQNANQCDPDENETDFSVLTPQEFILMSPQQRQELLDQRKETYYNAIRQLKMRKVKEMSVGEYVPEKHMVLVVLSRGKIIQTMGHRILKNVELHDNYSKYPLYFELADLNREKFAQMIANHYYSNRGILLYPEEALYLADCNSFALFTTTTAMHDQSRDTCQQLIDFVIEKPKPYIPEEKADKKTTEKKRGKTSDSSEQKVGASKSKTNTEMERETMIDEHVSVVDDTNVDGQQSVMRSSNGESDENDENNEAENKEQTKESASKSQPPPEPVYEDIKMRKGYLSPSLQSTYMLLTHSDNRLLNTFIVYSYLKRLGFVVRRIEARDSEPPRPKNEENPTTSTEEEKATSKTDSTIAPSANQKGPKKDRAKPKGKSGGRARRGEGFDAVSHHCMLIEEVRKQNPSASSRGWWAIPKETSSMDLSEDHNNVPHSESSDSNNVMNDDTGEMKSATIEVNDHVSSKMDIDSNHSSDGSEASTNEGNEENNNDTNVGEVQSEPFVPVEYEELFDEETWEILRSAMDSEYDEVLTSSNDFVLGSQSCFSSKGEVDRPLIEKLQLKDGQRIKMERLYRTLDIIQKTKLGSDQHKIKALPKDDHQKFIVFDVWRSSTYRSRPDTPDFNIIIQRFSSTCVQLAELFELYERFKPVPLYHAIVGDGGTVTFMKIEPIDLDFL